MRLLIVAVLCGVITTAQAASEKPEEAPQPPSPAQISAANVAAEAEALRQVHADTAGGQSALDQADLDASGKMAEIQRSIDQSKIEIERLQPLLQSLIQGTR
jgi:hypothetical protein